MRLFFSISVCFLLWGVVGCQPSMAQRPTKKKPKYNENLQIHHEHYTITPDQPITIDNIPVVHPQYDQSHQVDSVSDILAYEYSRYKKSRGYRILIYSGREEELAIEAQKKLRALKMNAYGDTTNVFRKIPIYPDYITPNFKITVGDYIDKLLAFQMLLQLKDEFPNALLIPVNDVKLENID